MKIIEKMRKRRINDYNLSNNEKINRNKMEYRKK